MPDRHLYVALLLNAKNERRAEVILKDESLIPEAIHGNWIVERYLYESDVGADGNLRFTPTKVLTPPSDVGGARDL